MSKQDKRLHAILNLGLTGLACLTLFSSLKLTPKLLLVSVLAIAAQRHSQKQELLMGDYQGAIAYTSNLALDEVGKGSTWLKGYFPELQPQQPKSRIGRILLDGYRALQAPVAPCEIYKACIEKSLIWTANTREGKTVAAHYALNAWIEVDPGLIIYSFDKHLNANNDPKFASNWLGVPQLKEVPKDIQTCAVKGKAEDLEEFLDNVMGLFNKRIAECSNTPNVLVIIDEFSNLLGELGDKEAEAIARTLSTIAAESQKFGIYFWLITHTLTKEELKINRLALRQCHIIMGTEMSQDRVQVSNSPRTLSAESLDYAAKQYRQKGGVPAGFITSLPVPNGYLPVPPLEGLDELLRDWVDEDEAFAFDPLQIEFLERLSDPSVTAAIAQFLDGKLDKGTDPTPRKALFRIVWQKGFKGDYQPMMDLLNGHLETIQQSQNQ